MVADDGKQAITLQLAEGTSVQVHGDTQSRCQTVPVFWSRVSGTTVSFLPTVVLAGALFAGACSSLPWRMLLPGCTSCGSTAAASHAVAAVTMRTASSGHAAVKRMLVKVRCCFGG